MIPGELQANLVKRYPSQSSSSQPDGQEHLLSLGPNPLYIILYHFWPGNRTAIEYFNSFDAIYINFIQLVTRKKTNIASCQIVETKNSNVPNKQKIRFLWSKYLKLIEKQEYFD